MTKTIEQLEAELTAMSLEQTMRKLAEKSNRELNRKLAELTKPVERGQPRIVCAAVLTEHGLVLGPRHYDDTMHNNLIFIQQEVEDAVQGFVDQFGVFHDRKAAFKIAQRAKQILHPSTYPTDELYSENLY